MCTRSDIAGNRPTAIRKLCPFHWEISHGKSMSQSTCENQVRYPWREITRCTPVLCACNHFMVGWFTKVAESAECLRTQKEKIETSPPARHLLFSAENKPVGYTVLPALRDWFQSDQFKVGYRSNCSCPEEGRRGRGKNKSAMQNEISPFASRNSSCGRILCH